MIVHGVSDSRGLDVDRRMRGQEDGSLQRLEAESLQPDRNEDLAGATKRSTRSMLNSPVSEQDRTREIELKPI